jgi:hypothetical protein
VQDFFRPRGVPDGLGQLYVEAYSLANTSRHLAEFWTIEPEIAFADLADNAALFEPLLRKTPPFATSGSRGLVAKLAGIVGSEFVGHRCAALGQLEGVVREQ